SGCRPTFGRTSAQVFRARCPFAGGEDALAGGEDTFEGREDALAGGEDALGGDDTFAGREDALAGGEDAFTPSVDDGCPLSGLAPVRPRSFLASSSSSVFGQSPRMRRDNERSASSFPSV